MDNSLAPVTENKYKKLYDKIIDECGENIPVILVFLEKQTYFMRRHYLLAICHYRKDCPDIETYRALLRNICLEDNLARVKRPPTKREKENFMKWEDIIKLRNQRWEAVYHSYGDHMIYVLLCLYTMIVPQRGQVYYNCYLDKDVEGSNFINLTTKVLVVREHKTKKTYGEIVLPICPELYDILKVYKEQWYKEEGGLLLKTSTGLAYNDSGFAKLMNTIFGKNISTNMLRKIYISSNVNIMDIDSRKQLASQMGHSVTTQEFMYNKKGIDGLIYD